MPPRPDSAFSSSSSPVRENIYRNTTNFRAANDGLKRRLTRQRKLRHLTDDELGLRPTIVNHRSPSLPVFPGTGSRQIGHWSKSMSALPQPLPLPEQLSSPFAKPKETFFCARDVHGNSPTSPATVTGSSLSRQANLKSPYQAHTSSSKCPTYCCRGLSQDVNKNFRLNVAARSAPSSSLSSPARSPRKFNTIDLHHSCQMPSPDHSPLHSPRLQSPCKNAKSPASIAVHTHHKLLPELFVTRPEGSSANVHPLPLPPGVSRQPQATTFHTINDKSDLPPMKGQWIKGKLIGAGTYGRVYEATNRVTGALCAMKEVDLIPDDPKCAECIKQLEQEIKTLRNLKHPNIVQFYGCEVVDDHFCIYLEYVYPGSVNKYIHQHGAAMTESIVRNFTHHIVTGLAYLHSKKTIHRDIKGANLLVDASGVVKLADFGLAKPFTGHAIDLSLKGSPHWVAPEVLQAVLLKDANPELALAVDIWSLGCTVIEMLTGKPPWSEYNGVQAMFSVLNKSPSIPETLSAEGKDFLRCCFQRIPAERPSALMLLEHPFIQNLHDQNFSVCLQEISALRILTPREWPRHDNATMPVSKDTCTKDDKLPCNGEPLPPSTPECSDYGAAERQSPGSTLEVLPTISSPELNCTSCDFNPTSNISNSLHQGAVNSYLYGLLRTHGREVCISTLK